MSVWLSPLQGEERVAGWLILLCICLLMCISPSLLLASLDQDGVMEKSNRLLNEQSPYLLQHAHNPVDWYPWGEEAFARAEKEDKPIFLSIGYSTCHWCHVMAHESFESRKIAALLNKWFVCIKVDREERPDIDQMYMAATQAMNGSGGWPMSVFTFPDGRPFWAATYIPPVGMQGQPGFPDILEAVHTAWTTRRDELTTAATRLVDALKAGEDEPSPIINSNAAEAAYKSLVTTFDSRYGGFGSAPKFPRPVNLSFLFHYWQETGNNQAKEMALSTLRAMAGGGMYDHLGGGFHRYSVDRQWRVSHFEKMLYDQAQLLTAYLDGYLISGEEQLAVTARQIADYVLRDMRDPAGGLYSAEDADSDDPYASGQHGEGAYYLWTEEDIVKTVGARDAKIFNYCYGVEFDGNALADPQQEFSGRNILYAAHTPLEAADHFQQPEAEIKKNIRRVARKLFFKRQQRKRPHLDDKVLTAWNGLMIGALARAGGILEEPRFSAAAREAAEFIRDHLYDHTKKTLLRRYRRGKAGLAGQLDDYSFLVSGLLNLYQFEQKPEWLRWAIDLTSSQIRLFADRKHGGFYDSLDDPTVVVRMKSEYDGAEPAANSVAAENLVRLGRLVEKSEWTDLAEKTIQSFSAQFNNYPQALVYMLTVYRELHTKPVQVVIAGKRDAHDTRALMKVVFGVYSPGSVLLLADSSENQDFLAQYVPSMATVAMQNNKATAYVCKQTTCLPPVTTSKALRELLISQPDPLQEPTTR